MSSEFVAMSNITIANFSITPPTYQIVSVVPTPSTKITVGSVAVATQFVINCQLINPPNTVDAATITGGAKLKSAGTSVVRQGDDGSGATVTVTVTNAGQTKLKSA